MGDIPDTRYAKTDDGAHIAFQVLGDGPPDLVFAAEGGSHLELDWEIPAYDRAYRRLASFSRLIRFDLRGAGLSDPLGPSEQYSLEGHAKDMLTALDAAGTKRAAVVANSGSGLLAIFFAASYPTRVSSLVLDGCYARLARAPDYPWGIPKELLDQAVARQVGGGGNVEHALRYTAPNAAKDPAFVAQWQRRGRSTGGPAAHIKTAEMLVFSDVRPLLSSVQAPTLVLYRRGDRYAGKPHAVYLKEHISDAKLVEVPGEDNLIFVGDSDADLDEIEEFLTGTRHAPATDRVLATVLFTDIVGSTEHLAELGDRKNGATSWMLMTGPCVDNWNASAAGRLAQGAMASSRPSMDPDEQSRAGARCVTPFGRWGSRFGWACTPVRSNSETTTKLRASPSTSEPASRNTLARRRSSCPPRSRTSSPGLALSSTIAASTSSSMGERSQRQ
jgi:pimeloyl-ACP methyl ester carboxylesterase